MRVHRPLPIVAHSVVTALGAGLDATQAALNAGRSGLRAQTFETADIETWLGVVEGLEDGFWADSLGAFDCRNNRLAEMALCSDGFSQHVEAAAQRWGSHRVGVFLGTSTSGILQTEQAYRQRDAITGALPTQLDYANTHNTYSVGAYVRQRLRLTGPAHVVSTACSSSAKVFAAAWRMIALGVVDAAVVGGVDSLCMTTLYGFKSLELVSSDICRPWDAQRKGLSLGEGAAFALLTRDAEAPLAWLLGYGESSDGYHMSSPHPQGLGAIAAMRQALQRAGLQPGDVDYLNLHGTATPGNDAAEDQAVAAVFGGSVSCSSTKGFTGHTLGAAGGVEASIALMTLASGRVPPNLNLLQQDPQLEVQVLRQALSKHLRVVASNSFGFGGSNCCLIFGHAEGFPEADGQQHEEMMLS
jgi:3-oxoacyl-[acyl-carrier-protein] synthase-1